MFPCDKCKHYNDLRCNKNMSCADAMNRWYMQDLFFLSCACSFFSPKKEHVISYEKFLEMLRFKQQLELFGAPHEVRGAPRGDNQKT